MPQFRFNTISRADIERSQGGNTMIQAIDYDGKDNQLVTGVPGSGKTTVTIMRAERLINQNKSILLLTFQNLLCLSLKNIAQSDMLKECIFGLYDWYPARYGWLDDAHTAEYLIERMKDGASFDEILIDEGQDFETRIFQALLTKCKRMTVGADNAQRVHSKGILSGAIKKELEKTNKTTPVRLEYNYRNTYEIYNFARYFLPDSERANNQFVLDLMPRGTGNMPVVIQTFTDEETRNRLKVILEDAGDRNIAILLYHTDDIDVYHQAINDMGFKATKWYYGHQPYGEIENIIITTYKAAKGLEFQVVVMPEMHNAMTEDFQTREHYYIGCTRAKENLFLIYTGSTLPRCLIGFDKDSYEFRPSEKVSKILKPLANTVEDLPF